MRKERFMSPAENKTINGCVPGSPGSGFHVISCPRPRNMILRIEASCGGGLNRAVYSSRPLGGTVHCCCCFTQRMTLLSRHL